MGNKLNIVITFNDDYGCNAVYADGEYIGVLGDRARAIRKNLEAAKQLAKGVKDSIVKHVVLSELDIDTKTATVIDNFFWSHDTLSNQQEQLILQNKWKELIESDK